MITEHNIFRVCKGNLEQLVERRSSAGVLSLSYARFAAEG